jgi:hypothetical protein
VRVANVLNWGRGGVGGGAAGGGPDSGCHSNTSKQLCLIHVETFFHAMLGQEGIEAAVALCMLGGVSAVA